MSDATDPRLLAFRDAVRRHFGERLERLVLYGSRARGDARPESDFDVAIFVKDLTNPYSEFAPLAGLVSDLLVDSDIEISAQIFPAERWHDEGSALIRNMHRDGLAL